MRANDFSGALVIADAHVHPAAGRALEPLDHLVAVAAEQRARAKRRSHHDEQAAHGGQTSSIG